MGTRIGLLKIPVLSLVLCLVLYTCFAFDCISAVLRDRCWFCCSVLTATVINEHYYYYYCHHCNVTHTVLAVDEVVLVAVVRRGTRCVVANASAAPDDVDVVSSVQTSPSSQSNRY